jgi:ketosteroid isomerase-like protein
MRTLTMSLILSMFLALGISSISLAQNSSGSVEDEIIALTYKIWKAENENDMATRKKYISEDYTEFNPSYSTLIEGRDKNFKLTNANNMSGKSLADEMLNPHVKVYGDVAILTYNFAGVIKGNDGKVTTSKAKSTRVYVKTNGTWMLVHANFAFDPTQIN